MKKQNSGQALLLILLSVGVIITVALSVVARSVTDISTTKKDEQSLRAFSAAEAGVEETLKTPVTTLPTNGGGVNNQAVGSGSLVTYTTTSNSFPTDLSQYIYPSELSAGDVATIWFSSHDPSNKLICNAGNPCYTANSVDICWGKVGATVNPAISASVIYDDGSGNLKVATAAFDKDTTRAGSSHFKSTGIGANCTISGTSLANRTTLTFGSIGIASPANHIRMILLRSYYNTEPTIVGVIAAGGGSLPIQGRRIESTGAAGTDATRKVQVNVLYPEIPNIFFNAIYSPLGVTK